MHVLPLRSQIAFKVLDDQEAGDPTVREMQFYVSLRPGLTDFLEKASALYEVGSRVGVGRLRWRCVLLRKVVEFLRLLAKREQVFR